MKIIGVTGGIGSGKSEVLKYLEKEYHAFICQADKVAKDLQKKGGVCYNDIVTSFGTDILNDEEELDREKLAEIVFHDPDKLKKLNEIVHPAVKEKIQAIVAEQKSKDTPLFLLEAALLLEEHYDLICDEVWYIFASDEARKKRLKYARGYSEERIEGIFASQMSRDEFLEHCDRAVDNSGSFADTCRQLNEIMKK